MADTLLRELSNADLDWMITRGQRQSLSAGVDLMPAATVADRVYVVIEGELGLIGSAGVTAEGGSGDWAEALDQGEVVGIEALFGAATTNAVRTLEPSLVMSLSVSALMEKLMADTGFAAHFYRAIAIMLSSRLRRLLERPERLQRWGDRSAREVLSVFAELRDSDIDWLVSFGGTELLPPKHVLQQAGRPVDGLYLLLEGQIGISAPPHGSFNPLYLCFSGLAESTRDQVPFATLAKGSMPGIISFLDFRPLPVTLTTLQESLVFTVPRQTLTTKLQVDPSFASRFYRVIAMEILALLQSLGPGGATGDRPDLPLDEELEMADLRQLSEGAQKFNWMLSQMGVARHG